ncbi:MAG: hypothetical protein CTY10_05025 [Methylotenera sp.]|nr:MAG: hypothetical protein CTY10_05025 [Methylotenera sp.]
MTWLKINIHESDAIDDKLSYISNAYEGLILDTKSFSNDFALFSQDLEESTLVFVSPALARVTPELSSTFKAVPCDKPVQTDEDGETSLSLLLAANSASAWALLA